MTPTPTSRWTAALPLLLAALIALAGAGSRAPTLAAGPTAAPGATATTAAGEAVLYLPLVLTDRCRTEEIEPNDTGHQAAQSENDLCLGVAVHGVMASPADYRDVYLLDLSEPTALRVVLDELSPVVDYDLALFDAANRPIAYATTRGSGPEEILIVEPLAPGRYLLMAYSYQGFSPQPYRLTASVPQP